MRCTDAGPAEPQSRVASPAPAGRPVRARAVRNASAVAASLCVLAACTPPAPPGARPAAPTPAASAIAPKIAAPAAVSREALGPPPPVFTIQQLRLQVARRLVAANPHGSYTGPPPDPLLAIPVLEVELNADGSVRRIEVLRQPREARDTTQLAIDAVRRAAPFGDVSHLPKPWKFSETFLFDDARRFKPRTLEP